MKFGPLRIPWLVVLLALLAVGALASVRAAANTVATSSLSDTAQAVTADQLKPSQCDSISLTAVVQGVGDFEGDTADELLLGSSASQLIRGRDGNDCLVGGAGTDDLRGDAGADVCIGTAGSTFADCEYTYTTGCAGTTAVSIGNFYFSPSPVTINVGCTVRWTNTANTQHTSTSDVGLWASPNLSKNQYYEYTFNVSPGTYAYRCSLHPTQTASVIVQ